MCRGTTCRKPSAIIRIKRYSTNNKKFESKLKNYFYNSTLKTKNPSCKRIKSEKPKNQNQKIHKNQKTQKMKTKLTEKKIQYPKGDINQSWCGKNPRFRDGLMLENTGYSRKY
jgi:hypothetical protein